MASGAALFALQPSGSPSRSLPIAQSLRSDLTGLDGTLLVDDVARQAAAVDFGRIVRRLPIAVLKAGSVQDVVKSLRFASLHGVRMAMRGQGHSMLGQAQSDAGVVIDSSGLNAIRITNYRGRPAVEAGPGALWGPVLDAANASKLTPPVNVDPTYLSVGGTPPDSSSTEHEYWRPRRVCLRSSALLCVEEEQQQAAPRPFAGRRPGRAGNVPCLSGQTVERSRA